LVSDIKGKRRLKVFKKRMVRRIRYQNYSTRKYLYVLLTAIGLMPSGSVYKDHTLKKDISRKQHNTSHEFSQYNTRT
jgi:mRNA-degrading endonuclease YafQ of YafQ-DinJ toxin-antitoxin module